MSRDILTQGLAKHIEKYLESNAKITYAAGGAVVVENPAPRINYFFIGKATTRTTGEFYLITIYVHEPGKDLELDGRAVISVRRGFMGIGKRITVDGSGKIRDIVLKLKDEGLLDTLYGSGYETIIVRLGFKTPFLETGDKSIVLIGRSSIFYSFRPGRFVGKLYLSGKKIFTEILNQVYQ